MKRRNQNFQLGLLGGLSSLISGSALVGGAVKGEVIPPPSFTLTGPANLKEGVQGSWSLAWTGTISNAVQITLAETLSSDMTVDLMSAMLAVSQTGVIVTGGQTFDISPNAVSPIIIHRTPADDHVTENETYTLRIASASAGVIFDGTTVSTVLSDGPPSFAITGPASITEGVAANWSLAWSGGVIPTPITLTLAETQAGDMTNTLATALAALSLTGVSTSGNTITIGATAASPILIPRTATSDFSTESESYSIAITAATAGAFNSTPASATIVDGPPTFALTGPSTLDAGVSGNYSLAWSGGTISSNITVTLAETHAGDMSATLIAALASIVKTGVTASGNTLIIGPTASSPILIPRMFAVNSFTENADYTLGISGVTAGAFNATLVTTGVIVTRNAVGIFAPGHGTNAAPAASVGTTITSAQSFVNSSGAPITDIGLLYAGFNLRSVAPGYTDVGNTVPVTATIEYPVGTPIATITKDSSGTINIASGSTPTKTDIVNLGATPIPAGATFKVTSVSNLTTGLKYAINLGLAGVLTKARKSTLKKECLFMVGDSIATINNAFLGIINNKCPISQMSITGTRADLYSGDFTRQSKLAAALGATRCVCDFSVNDTNGSQSAATTRDVLLSLQSQMATAGVPKFTQTTQTPQSTMRSVTPSSVTSSGTTMTIVVPDATLFDLNQFYILSGATQTEYNIPLFVESLDVGTNTITCPFVGSATPTATGTMVIQSYKAANTRKFQVPGGAKAVRDTLNGYIRSGIFTGGVLEWGDALEKTRGDDIFISASDGDSRSMPPQAGLSITSLISGTRFNTQTILSGVSGLTGGALICLNGANRGKMASAVNGNSTADITAIIPTGGAAWAVSDTFAVLPGSATITDDRLHPRVAIANKGGQQFLVDATSSWIDALLA